jgi:hypothetical protein
VYIPEDLVRLEDNVKYYGSYQMVFGFDVEDKQVIVDGHPAALIESHVDHMWYFSFLFRYSLVVFH